MLNFSHCMDLDSDPHFCKGGEFESESVPESVSGNVNEPSRAIFPFSLIDFVQIYWVYRAIYLKRLHSVPRPNSSTDGNNFWCMLKNIHLRTNSHICTKFHLPNVGTCVMAYWHKRSFGTCLRIGSHCHDQFTNAWHAPSLGCEYITRQCTTMIPQRFVFGWYESSSTLSMFLKICVKLNINGVLHCTFLTFYNQIKLCACFCNDWMIFLEMITSSIWTKHLLKWK